MVQLAGLVVVLVLTAGSVAAQDARGALQAAAETLGVTNMTSIQYSGTGWLGAVGQSFAPDQDWPRFELASYTRTIDFGTNSSKEEMVVRQGDYSARGEQPTKLQSSWWKSSRVNCPCRTRSDATSRGRQPTGRCVV